MMMMMMMTTTTTTTTSELPEHLKAVYQAVMDGLDDEPLVSQAELDLLRAELLERLQSVVSSCPDGVELYLDGYALSAVLRCPASNVDVLFAWTAPFAARSLGLPALGEMLNKGSNDALGAVETVIDEAIQEDRSLGQWLHALGHAERAATVAVAASWASRAWIVVPWSSLGSVRLNFSGSWFRPLGFESSVVLRGRPDAVVLVRKGAQERVLLRLGWPDEATSGLDAVVTAMELRRAPLRSVTINPASGCSSAYAVDAAFLRRSIDRIVAALEALARVAEGDLPREVPGSQCWFCKRRDECTTGTLWMASQPRRVGGIPIGETSTD
jgi:hypothetical protein